ncbi:transmembrane protein 183-like [Ptychodera flava]|uniref:transmembrane protein 183-like n=1 Tax=Ptychodera flava TaxID=63121 RepID=UPI00396A044F
MPKRSRKGRGKGSRNKLAITDQTDVTVNDFANADGSQLKSGRQSKASTNAMIKEVRSLCGPASEEKINLSSEDDLAWYDKDFSCDEDDLMMDDDENDAGVEKKSSPKTVKRKQKKVVNREDLVPNDDGKEYPIDVWCLLSNFIDPEDVGHFAGINRATFHVTNTMQFWLKLYHRYYRADCQLPACLQPNAIDRTLRLRASVIRALFIMYKPFQSRIRSSLPMESITPHCLVNAQCLYTWIKQRASGPWNFFFKFRMPDSEHRLKRNCIIPYEDDIWNNPEHSCCVLSVSCLNFIRIPVVMGMILTNVYLNVSRDMKHFNLKLVFHTAREKGHYHSNSGVVVTLDPITNARILHWWHPHYPGNE